MFVVGWVSANWDKKQQKDLKEGASTDFEQIILFLSEEKLSEASHSLLSAAKKDPNSFELQLSLGILYRRKGLIDRAMEVHGALLLVNNTSNQFRDRIVLELAKDYLEAGLYDRADLSLELLEKSKFNLEALELRLYLAQRLKDWSEAIIFVEELEKLNHSSYLNLKIHFLCEMAEQGDKTAREKAKKIGFDHPRVKAWDLVLSGANNLSSSVSSFICSSCGANFSTHFWRCHVCNTWDSAN